MKHKNKICVYTIGHSTRSIEDFLEILKHYQISQVIDVRSLPYSSHNPQFNNQELARYLRNRRIGYRHQKDLGGRRRTRKDSINTAWRSASFRGYADYMQTDEFKYAIEKLIEIAHHKITVIMCAEAVPWRCHRSLIGDALLARGIQVEDIYSVTLAKPHALTAFAVVAGKDISYPS